MKSNKNLESRYFAGINHCDTRIVKSTFEKLNILPSWIILNEIKFLGNSHEKFGELYNYFSKEIQKKYQVGIDNRDSKIIKATFNRSRIFPSNQKLEEIKILAEGSERFKNLANHLYSFKN